MLARQMSALVQATQHLSLNEASRQTGLAVTTIRNWRRKLSLPTDVRRGVQAGRTRTPLAGTIDEQIKETATLPLEVAARQIDVSWQTVRTHRIRLGLSTSAAKDAKAERSKNFENHPEDERHGTANGYRNYRCRCAECTQAWTEYTRERRAGGQ